MKRVQLLRPGNRAIDFHVDHRMWVDERARHVDRVSVERNAPE
jgi:hypothetical protein